MPEPPEELERGYAAARAAFEAHAAKLSPDELGQFLDQVAVAIQKASERDGVPEGYVRDLLRQLGVRADLDDPTEYWRQLWAEFRRLGFSEMEFWLQTPRDGCAVLESELRARSGRIEVSTPAKRRNAASARSRDPVLEDLSHEVREMKGEKLSHRDMCVRLDANRRNTPPGARWGGLTWCKAYKSEKYGGRVKKWLSKAGVTP